MSRKRYLVDQFKKSRAYFKGSAKISGDWKVVTGSEVEPTEAKFRTT